MAQLLFLPASFDGIPFPVTSITAVGAIRYHLHEYPHRPGSDPEKMGRKSYSIKMSAWFDESDGRVKDYYPDLYPYGLSNLRASMEAQKTALLVIPTIGQIQAFAPSWQQKWTSARLSGEEMDLEFIEDQSKDFIVGNGQLELGDTRIEAKAARVKILAEASDLDDGDLSLLDAISDAVGQVTAIRDGALKNVSLLESKIRKVETLCDQVKKTANFYQSAEYVQLGQAVNDLQYSAVAMAQSLVAPVVKIAKFITPRVMSITDVAITLFNDTAKAVDILKLNELSDALRIPAGTKLLYPK